MNNDLEYEIYNKIDESLVTPVDCWTYEYDSKKSACLFKRNDGLILSVKSDGTIYSHKIDNNYSVQILEPVIFIFNNDFLTNSLASKLMKFKDEMTAIAKKRREFENEQKLLKFFKIGVKYDRLAKLEQIDKNISTETSPNL